MLVDAYVYMLRGLRRWTRRRTHQIGESIPEPMECKSVREDGQWYKRQGVGGVLYDMAVQQDPSDPRGAEKPRFVSATPAQTPRLWCCRLLPPPGLASLRPSCFAPARSDTSLLGRPFLFCRVLVAGGAARKGAGPITDAGLSRSRRRRQRLVAADERLRKRLNRPQAAGRPCTARPAPHPHGRAALTSTAAADGTGRCR